MAPIVINNSSCFLHTAVSDFRRNFRKERKTKTCCDCVNFPASAQARTRIRAASSKAARLPPAGTSLAPPAFSSAPWWNHFFPMTWDVKQLLKRGSASKQPSAGEVPQPLRDLFSWLAACRSSSLLLQSRAERPIYYPAGQTLVQGWWTVFKGKHSLQPPETKHWFLSWSCDEMTALLVCTRRDLAAPIQIWIYGSQRQSAQD